MLAPYRWIKDYADVECSPEELAARMVMTGSGVEGIEDTASEIRNVVVGRIDKIVKHPNADKLVICTLDIGRDEPVQIVTGATNVFEGALVPVAVATAALPDGREIKKGKLRGEVSEGMLCSGEELQLTEEQVPGAGVDGILILQGDYTPGQDIRDALDLHAPVIEFEIGANRPDCLSMIGIAREAAAATEVPFHMPDNEYEGSSVSVKDMVSVEVLDQDLCPRYIAAGVNDVVIEESPEWMRRRLIEAGIRPINNIVDITNFVMLETGQPMHAFDADKIRGRKIVVRRAGDGETMATLDGKERTFTEDMLLICDAEGPIGIAGVMGGLDSEITPDTKTVIFEAAKFGYGNIRKTSRRLGLSTESSMRFSKGVEAHNTLFAMRRALALVEQLKAGVPASELIDVAVDEPGPRIIKTTAARTNAILGTSLTAREMQELLERAFIHTGLIGDELVCTVPVFRGDVIGPNDIAEEVARMYGYDNIADTNARVELRIGRIPGEELTRDRMAQYLVDNGFYQCMTYSFAGAADYEPLGMPVPENVVAIMNPLGDDRAFMRQTLVPAMLRTVALNLNRGTHELRLFEMARVYIPEPGEQLPQERQTMCVAMTGGDADFGVLRSIIADLVFVAIRRPMRVKYEEAPWLSEAACGEIIVKGRTIGTIGEVAARTAEGFGVDQKTFIAQLDLSELLSIEEAPIRYEKAPKHPPAMRDLAVVVDQEIGAGDILEEAAKAGGKLLEEAHVLSVYQGKNIEDGKKSVAVSLTLRSKDSTLTDGEADAAVQRILRALEKKFGARLR